MQKEFGLSRFGIFNETVEDANRMGKMKFRSWAVPYRIDLMTPEDLGSCEGRGTIFSLGQKVDIAVCQNDTEVPFQTLGKIEQEFTFLLRKYKIFNSANEQVAHAEENLSFATIDIDIKSADGSLVYAKLATKPFVNLMETWEITVKAELPEFDWRPIMYLVSVISYNRQ